MKGNSFMLVAVAAIGAVLYFVISGRKPPGASPRSGGLPNATAQKPTALGFAAPLSGVPAFGSINIGGQGSGGGGGGGAFNPFAAVGAISEAMKALLGFVKSVGAGPASTAPRPVQGPDGPSSSLADYQHALQIAAEEDPANYTSSDYVPIDLSGDGSANAPYAAPSDYFDFGSGFQTVTPDYAIHTLSPAAQAAYYGEDF